MGDEEGTKTGEPHGAPLDRSCDDLVLYASMPIQARVRIPGHSSGTPLLSCWDDLSLPRKLDQTVRSEAMHGATMRFGSRPVGSRCGNHGWFLGWWRGEQEDPAGTSSQADPTQIPQFDGLSSVNRVSAARHDFYTMTWGELAQPVSSPVCNELFLIVIRQTVTSDAGGTARIVRRGNARALSTTR